MDFVSCVNQIIVYLFKLNTEKCNFGKICHIVILYVYLYCVSLSEHLFQINKEMHYKTWVFTFKNIPSHVRSSCYI